MAVEIEAKMQLQDPREMALRLRASGAVAMGEFLEINSFYDTKDCQMLARDEGLRLRILKNLKSGQETYVLTHKGPNLPGTLKMREETELAVDNARAAEKLLEHLGFVRWLRFEKRRDSWEFEGCKIELDRLPVLGSFIEIEGPTEAAVMAAREKLGLTSWPLVKKGYAKMVGKYLEEHGGNELTFENAHNA